jgi:uncharacterized protein YjbJ (UPF0337 family)
MELVLNKGNWEELKTKLRKNYPQLTDTDMVHEEGMEESMLRMIEYKLGKTKEEMKEIIAGYSQFSI